MNPRWRTATTLKILILQLSNRSTDGEEILHENADCVCKPRVELNVVQFLPREAAIC